MTMVIAQAHPNIALVKYWGKRNLELNLPSVPSLSITLDGLTTRTQLELDPGLETDECVLNGELNTAVSNRISKCLDGFRDLSGNQARARVSSENNFPTAAGLASSAAGFAALVVAANEAFQTKLTTTRLSQLARRASGSAGRSLYGGFAEQNLGVAIDGSDCQVNAVAGASHWPLEVVVAITSEHVKHTSSSAGMLQSAASSAYFSEWVDTAPADLQTARQAVLNRDFQQLSSVSESSCLKMHAVMLASQPGLLYWNGATVDAIHTIRQLREAGSGCFFTIDAGPQVKAVCLPGHSERVAQALSDVPGVQKILRCGLGPGASLVNP